MVGGGASVAGGGISGRESGRGVHEKETAIDAGGMNLTGLHSCFMSPFQTD